MHFFISGNLQDYDITKIYSTDYRNNMETCLSFSILETIRHKDIDGITFGALADLNDEQGNIYFLNLSNLFANDVNLSTFTATRTFNSFVDIRDNLKASYPPA